MRRSAATPSAGTGHHGRLSRRAGAKRILGEVESDRDPAKERQRSRQAERDAPTVREVAE